jgi:vacuolar-type H+-ATPase subunit I/STV1
MELLKLTMKFIKANYKLFLYIALGLTVLYFFIQVITPKPKISEDFQRKLDSLNLVTEQLKKQQLSYDSAITADEKKIDEIDHQIDNVKEKTTIIKEYYHEQGQAINNFNSSQLDSFFAKRYGY